MYRLILILLFSAFAWADEVQILYASKVKSLYKEGEIKIVGMLLPTAKVEVMERKDGRVLLRIQGYAPKAQRQAPQAAQYLNEIGTFSKACTPPARQVLRA